jgi:hypothetical protein
LKSQSVKDLAAIAKRKGVAGWNSMRKEQLVKALVRRAKVQAANKVHEKSKPAGKSPAKASRKARPRPAAPKAARSAKSNPTKVNGKSHVRPTGSPKVVLRIQKVHAERERLKDLSQGSSVSRLNGKSARDRLVLMVRDSYWLQAVWTVTPHSVKRAEAALAAYWHTARPCLRLLEVDGGLTTSTAERVVREIEIHGGVSNWYIEAPEPPHSYRVDIGYRASNGKFFVIARSQAVTTPAPNSSDAIDNNWSDIAANYEKVYAMSGGYSEEHSSGDLQELFEERLKRPMLNPTSAQFGSGAERVLNRHRNFGFHVDAEMILFGKTRPDARVMLAGEPVKLRPDGSFTVRLSMPDKRQVLPVVASSADGVEQRTVVIAVERNTKVLEPMVREVND